MADSDKEETPPEIIQEDNDKVVFTPEQQAAIDKIVRGARTKAIEQAHTEFEAAQVKATEKAEAEALAKQLKDDKQYGELITQHESKIAEIEPALESANAVIEDFSKIVQEILDSRLETFGEAAKNAVDNLPGNPDLLAKLNWLTANEKLFEIKDPSPGTPPLKGAKDPNAKKRGPSPINIRF